jgi:hypothetical protein
MGSRGAKLVTGKLQTNAHRELYSQLVDSLARRPEQQMV